MFRIDLTPFLTLILADSASGCQSLYHLISGVGIPMTRASNRPLRWAMMNVSPGRLKKRGYSAISKRTRWRDSPCSLVATASYTPTSRSSILQNKIDHINKICHSHSHSHTSIFSFYRIRQCASLIFNRRCGFCAAICSLVSTRVFVSGIKRLECNSRFIFIRNKISLILSLHMSLIFEKF